MEETKDLKMGLLILVILDIAVFVLGLFINSFSDVFGIVLLLLMCFTGGVWSELRRRENDGEISGSYP